MPCLFNKRPASALVVVLTLASLFFLGCGGGVDWYECDEQDCSNDVRRTAIQYCDPDVKGAQELENIFRTACQAPHPGGIDKCPRGDQVCSVQCRKISKSDQCPIIIRP